MIDIHSQHKTLEIFGESFQTGVLDAFAKNKDLLSEYQGLYESYKKTKSEVAALEKQAAESKKESEYLHFRYDELEKAKLQEGEQKELEDELDILTHNEDIKIAVSTSSMLIISAEEGTVLQKLKEAENELQKISPYYPKAQELFSRIQSVYIELDDIGRELDTLNENTEYSPERLDFVNSRLTTIYNLEKKFSVASVEELITQRDDLKKRLDLIDNSDERIAEKKKELKGIVKKLSSSALRTSSVMNCTINTAATKKTGICSIYDCVTSQFCTRNIARWCSS